MINLKKYTLPIIFFILVIIFAILFVTYPDNQPLLIGMLSSGMASAVGFLLAALGEGIGQKSGVLNMGVEGMMLLSAFGGFWGYWYFGNPIIGLILAIILGGGLALIHSIVSITLRANQVISGIMLWLVATGLSSFLNEEYVLPVSTFPRVDPLPSGIPILADFPVIGPIIFQQSWMFYASIALTILVSFMLYRTVFGLQIQSVGENPRAADSVGVRVLRVRYLAVIIGGVMAGLSGYYFSVGLVSTFRPFMTGGRGWIAIVIAVFGKWDPKRIFAGALIFGIADAIQLRLQALFSEIPGPLISTLPFVLAIISVIFVSRKGEAPSAMAQPYSREEKE
jgi:simple sugar transport system permease protein